MYRFKIVYLECIASIVIRCLNDVPINLGIGENQQVSDVITDQKFLQFTDVKKSYDQKNLVVKGFDLDVAEGEFITLLGPSGSGKTTILMMMAGFEGVTHGDIKIGGKSVTRLAPHKRNIGMVFQTYALFPHMTVAENLAYPLQVRKVAKAEVAERVTEFLNLVELGEFGDRFPAQLSGGQKQRVALARALIFKPDLVLMDEPLGALDKKLREQMQFEIKNLHENMGFTVIYVTHDQGEALTMSDRIAVFNDGVVQQCAAPNDLYERPNNAFVADFIGENNLVSGTALSAANDQVHIELPGGAKINAHRVDFEGETGPCIVSVRPEKMFLKPTKHAFDNEVEAKFIARHYVGDFIRYYFKLQDGSEIIVKLLNDQAAPKFSKGEVGHLVWLSSDCFAFKNT